MYRGEPESTDASYRAHDNRMSHHWIADDIPVEAFASRCNISIDDVIMHIRRREILAYVRQGGTVALPGEQIYRNVLTVNIGYLKLGPILSLFSP